MDATTHHIPDRADVRRWVTSIAHGCDVLVAAGGDGTVSVVAAVAVDLGKELGVIPSGTLNHFARDAGIPTELDRAVGVLAAGHSRLLDVGTVNDLVFINNASIGVYPRMVWQRNRTRRKGWPRPLSVAVAVIRAWLELRPLALHVCTDGSELIRRSPFLFVGNSAYEVEGMNFGRRPHLTDGTLSVYVAPESGRLDVLTFPLRALGGALKAHEKFETWQASTISVNLARRRVAVALDGEIHTVDTPLCFTVRCNALRTIVPAPETGEP